MTGGRADAGRLRTDILKLAVRFADLWAVDPHQMADEIYAPSIHMESMAGPTVIDGIGMLHELEDRLAALIPGHRHELVRVLVAPPAAFLETTVVGPATGEYAQAALWWLVGDPAGPGSLSQVADEIGWFQWAHRNTDSVASRGTVPPGDRRCRGGADWYERLVTEAAAALGADAAAAARRYLSADVVATHVGHAEVHGLDAVLERRPSLLGRQPPMAHRGQPGYRRQRCRRGAVQPGQRPDTDQGDTRRHPRCRRRRRKRPFVPGLGPLRCGRSSAGHRRRSSRSRSLSPRNQNSAAIPAAGKQEDNTMEQLSGGIAVVTGAASGIGRAVAEAFAREGMRVVLADIEAAALDCAVSELRGDGHDVLGIVTDVSSAESVEHLRDRAIEHFGAVDVLHNNAGVVAAGPVEDIPLETWRWVVDVDLWSVVYGIRAFVPLMKRRGRGHVINTASTAGLQANPGIAPYNVAKFGVIAITETLRVECEGTGVSASVLCPGAVNTNIVRSERNRPAHVPESTGAIAERFAASSTRLLGEQGLAPAAVAAMVIGAVRANRFWVITHPGWIDVVCDRAAAMADGDLARSFAG